jgi:hypothetical protein
MTLYCQTNFYDVVPQPGLEVATEEGELWSQELYDSGGLLELIKCSYHYIFGQMESRI